MHVSKIIEASLVAAVISDPQRADNPIIACNDAFLRLTGYTREEVIGRNCRFLRGPGTEPAATQQLRDAVARQQPLMVEILNYRKDGTPFRNAVMIAPIFDEQGKLAYFPGSQVEVSTDGPDRREQCRQLIEGLSKRQRQILIEIAGGKLNKQIAFDLGLSERTVKMHRAAVLKALGVRTSADAIRIAVEAGY